MPDHRRQSIDLTARALRVRFVARPSGDASVLAWSALGDTDAATCHLMSDVPRLPRRSLPQTIERHDTIVLRCPMYASIGIDRRSSGRSRRGRDRSSLCQTSASLACRPASRSLSKTTCDDEPGRARHGGCRSQGRLSLMTRRPCGSTRRFCC